MRIVPSLVAALLAIGSGTAFAATVTVSGSVTNFRYQLIDLTPNDGVSPSIQFNWGLSPKGALYTQPDWTRLYAANDNRDAQPVNLTMGGSTLSGQVTLDAVTLDMRIVAGSGEAYMENLGFYTLSPNTRVIFSADATIAKSVEPGGFGAGWAGLAGMIDPVPGEVPISFTGGALEAGDRPASGLVSVSGESGAQSASGAMFITVYGRASSAFTSPVPEPSAASMCAAGLALLAGLARRRSGRTPKR